MKKNNYFKYTLILIAMLIFIMGWLAGTYVTLVKLEGCTIRKYGDDIHPKTERVCKVNEHKN